MQEYYESKIQESGVQSTALDFYKAEWLQGGKHMDVGGVLTVTLSDAKTRNDIGMAILAKQMDTEEQAGVAMIDMMNKSFMEKSVNPKVGGNIDISIWKNVSGPRSKKDGVFLFYMQFSMMLF